MERRQSGPADGVRAEDRALLFPLGGVSWSRAGRPGEVYPVDYFAPQSLPAARWRIVTRAGARPGDFHARSEERRHAHSLFAAMFRLPLRAALHQYCVVRCGHGQVNGPVASGGYPAVEQHRQQRAVSARRLGAVAGRDLDGFQSQRQAWRYQRSDERRTERSDRVLEDIMKTTDFNVAQALLP